MVLWAEIPFVDEALPTELFAENAREQMRELIRQNYNHPAIFFWGCGNENFDAGVGFASGIAKYGPVSERLIQSLHDLVHAEDPARLTTYASFHSEKDVHLALPGQPPVDVQGEPQRWYTDLTAFNKYYGWYYGEPEDNAEFFDSLHARNPTQRLAVSEYGAGGSINQHEAKRYGTPRVDMEKMRASAFAPMHPEEYQAYYHERTWAVLKARPYLWAKFIWNMFDFASDGRKEGDAPGRNDKGLVSFDRQTRKDAFYFYKANWSPQPVLHIASRRFTERVSPVTDVKVYANAADVELFVNGRSLGRRPVSEGIGLWPDVTLQPGENRIKVSATIAGAALTDECAWTLKAAEPKK
jgi:beta-galactosidase